MYMHWIQHYLSAIPYNQLETNKWPYKCMYLRYIQLLDRSSLKSAAAETSLSKKKPLSKLWHEAHSETQFWG